MSYEDIKPLVDELVESMSPDDACEIHKFAESCLNVSSVADIKNFSKAQRILKLNDSNALRNRVNDLLLKINPHLNPHAIWESGN